MTTVEVDSGRGDLPPPADEEVNISEIELPLEVEEVLATLGMKEEAVDQADFSVVAYINEMFPTEQSLSCMEEEMARMKTRIGELDEETRRVIRGQGASQEKAQQVVQEATSMIQTLFAKIREVQDRATRSEEMVRDITRDIQQLDQAKKNLTWSITTLNNLSLLIEAVDRLKTILGLQTSTDPESTQPLSPIPGTSQVTPLPYSEIVDRLSQASRVLDQVLGRYLAIPVVSQLDAETNYIKLEISIIIVKDFKEMLTGPSARHLQSSTSNLQSACHVVDLLEERVKIELIGWLVKLQLTEYSVLFEESQSTAWLDKIDHRYTWLRTCLAQFDKKFTHVFPHSWFVMERIVVEFCRITKEALQKIMARRKPEMTHNLLVFALQRTHAFETHLARSFSGETLLQSNGAGRGKDLDDLDESNPFYQDVQNEESEKEQPPSAPKQDTSPFDGIISTCFEEHMHLYIENVDKMLQDQLMNRLIGDLTVTQSGMSAANKDIHDVLNKDASGAVLQTGAAPVSSDPAENTLCSATDLFLVYKKILKQSVQLSRRETLVRLSVVLKRHIADYTNQALTGQLPVKKPNQSLGMNTASANQLIQSLLRDEQMIKLSKEDLHRACVILVTANYCLKTVEDLEKKLKDEVEPQLASQISFSSEVDLLGQCRSACVQLLATDLEACCGPAMVTMSKLHWNQMESVGDQSGYVTAIIGHFRTNVPIIRDTLHNVRAYFTQFCIKFANGFTAKYIQNLFKCKPISTVGAEQLLLDTHSLKTALLEMPIINTKFHPAPPRSFTNLVLQGMGKAEMIMKAVMTPSDKPAPFVDSYRQLLPDSDPAEMQKILEMKGLRRQEQNIILDLYRDRLSQQKQPKSSSANANKMTPPRPPPLSSTVAQAARTTSSTFNSAQQSTTEMGRMNTLEKIIKKHVK